MLLTPAVSSLDLKQSSLMDGLIGGNGRDLMTGGGGAGGAIGGGLVIGADAPAGGLARE